MPRTKQCASIPKKDVSEGSPHVNLKKQKSTKNEGYKNNTHLKAIRPVPARPEKKYSKYQFNIEFVEDEDSFEYHANEISLRRGLVDDKVKQDFIKDKDFFPVRKNDKLHPVWFYINEHLVRITENGLVTFSVPLLLDDRPCVFKFVNHRKKMGVRSYDDDNLIDWCARCLAQTQANMSDNESIY